MARFGEGQKQAGGGKRKGAGRKPDWFKDRCRQVACSEAYFKWAQGVVDGTVMDTKVTKDGEVIEVPVCVADRKAVWESMRDTGFGKPASVIDMGDGEDQKAVIGVVCLPVVRKE